MAGSLLGCLLTNVGLPQHWTEALSDSAWLVRKSDAVASLLAIYPPAALVAPPPTYTPAGPYDPHGDADTLLDAGKGMLAEEELERRWSLLIKGLEEKVAEETRGK